LGTDRVPGVPCGDPIATDCDLRDVCDGFGACSDNLVPDSTPCTDDGNDCTSDSCLTGLCVHPNKSANVPCGDPSTTTCTSPDSCDGGGVCLPNHTIDGTACDDNDPFTSPDACSGGVCVGATVPPPIAVGVNAFRVRITPQPAGSLVPQAIFITGDSTNPFVSCASGYVQTDGTLAPTPVFRSAADWGVIEAMDRLVMRPSTFVGVQAETLDGARTDPTLAGTLGYGDTNNDGNVNVFDLFCILKGFAGDFSACTFVDADLHPCVANATLNIFDLFEVLNAFAGQGFPCAGPCAGGACCGGGNCSISLATQCVLPSQTFLGDGTDCTPSPCPPLATVQSSTPAALSQNANGFSSTEPSGSRTR